MTLVDISRRPWTNGAFLAIALTLCSGACKKDKKEAEGASKTTDGTKPDTAEPAKCDTPMAAPTAQDGPEWVDPAVVIEWNKVAQKVQVATAKPGFGDFDRHLRGWAIMHIAMHDALNSIRPVYQRKAFTGCQPDAHPTAAIAQAAHDVLAKVYPEQQKVLDDELTAWLAKIPADKRKDSGVALGKAAAAAVLASREDDGVLTEGEKYAAKPAKAGQYQFTKGFDFVHKPWLGKAKGFALTSPDQFRPGPPPATKSPEYAKAFDEVKKLGSKTSKDRSKDQTLYGAFWLQWPIIGWDRAAANIVASKKLDLYTTARLYALIEMAIWDAIVAVWDAKMHYDFWRPITAVQMAKDDDNPKTVPDPKWESWQAAPPFQDYPSAHALESRAAAEVIKSVIGTDEVDFEFESNSAGVAGPDAPKTRAFKSLSAAAKEAGESRIMIGFHFRFSVDAGLAAGEKVGANVAATQLQPLKK